MKNVLRFSVLPVIGLFLLVVFFYWSGRDLRLRFFGQPAEGRIVGMALQRADGTGDLVTGLETDLALTLADGEILKAHFRNDAFESAVLISPGGTSCNLSASELQGGSIGSEMARVVSDALRGDAEILRWALLREGRRPEDPRRVVRIQKTETIRGHFDLQAIPVGMSLQDGWLVLDGPDGEPAPVETATIRAVFDRSDPAMLQKNKGDSMVSYESLRDGEAFTPERKNFFLYAEPYGTQFLPVFGFDAEGKTVARLSHIGRHGGPTLALQLFGGCRVFYDPQNPSEAILTAVPGAVNGDPLGWFSRLCEGTFSQWGSGSLILLAGLVFLLTGLLFISLVVFRSKTIS